MEDYGWKAESNIEKLVEYMEVEMTNADYNENSSALNNVVEESSDIDFGDEDYFVTD